MIKQVFSHPFVKWLFTAIFLVGAVHLISAFTYDRTLQYKEVVFQSEKIAPSLDGYTIAFLTDIHAYPHSKLETVVENLNERGISLVLLGGDFPGGAALSPCIDILAALNAPDGIYSVDGNHDNPRVLAEELQRYTIPLLENQGVQIREGLYLAGTEDLYYRSPDAQKAITEAGEDDFVLMLCHNPDTSVACDFTGVDLTLSGHTHGGEVTVFGLFGPAMPLVSRYGQRFRSAWAQSGAGTPVYVSNGIGNHFPIRVFAPPQVILLTLRAATTE